MNCIVIDSEYCSMGRWISVIVANALHMKLYEGKDLIALVDEPWLTEESLSALDYRLGKMSLEEARQDKELKKVHAVICEAVLEATRRGPCIIHERAASDVLKNQVGCLKVLLYNTNMEHRISRALADKTYDLSDFTREEIIAFINQQDRQRKNYHDAVCLMQWGNKEHYDLCLDSDVLSREKCAEILITAMKEVSLNAKECEDIIKGFFV